MISNILLATGIIIIAGFLGGALAIKTRLPRITGYIVVGVILSPSLFNLISNDTLESFNPIISIALGIIAYLIGGSLRIDSLRTLQKSIAWITPFQSLAPWLLMTIILTFTGSYIVNIPGATLINTYLPVALLLGAMSCTTAPAIVIAIVHECKAEGTFTSTLLAVVALTDIIAVIAFAIAIGIAKPLINSNGNISFYQMLVVPFIHIFISLGIGIAIAFLTAFITRWLKIRTVLLVIVTGAIIVAMGLAELLDGSSLLTCLTFGFIIANIFKRDDMIVSIIEIEDLVFTVFFVLSGMFFDFDTLRTSTILIVMIIIIRIIGKYSGAMLGGYISKAPDKVRKYIGFALLPQAGLVLGLAFIARDTFPLLGNIIFNSTLASVIFYSLITPPLLKHTITKVGEHPNK